MLKESELRKTFTSTLGDPPPDVNHAKVCLLQPYTQSRLFHVMKCPLLGGGCIEPETRPTLSHMGHTAHYHEKARSQTHHGNAWIPAHTVHVPTVSTALPSQLQNPAGSQAGRHSQVCGNVRTFAKRRDNRTLL